MSMTTTDTDLWTEDARRQYGVPEHTFRSLHLYVTEKIRTGSFLRAVLTNDLFEAMGRADIENSRRMKEICTFIWSRLPRGCWGSEKAVTEWLKR